MKKATYGFPSLSHDFIHFPGKPTTWWIDDWWVIGTDHEEMCHVCTSMWDLFGKIYRGKISVGRWLTPHALQIESRWLHAWSFWDRERKRSAVHFVEKARKLRKRVNDRRVVRWNIFTELFGQPILSPETPLATHVFLFLVDGIMSTCFCILLLFLPPRQRILFYCDAKNQEWQFNWVLIFLSQGKKKHKIKNGARLGASEALQFTAEIGSKDSGIRTAWL